MALRAMRIDHLAFASFDAAATYRFYTEVMGFQLTGAFDGVSEEWGNAPYLMTTFAFASGEIHFFDLAGIARPPSDGLPKDIRHVALAVRTRAEFARWKRRLTAHRVAFWVEDHDDQPSLYFSDPNGVMFEIACQPRRRTNRRPSAAARAVVRRWTAAHSRP